MPGGLWEPEHFSTNESSLSRVCCDAHASPPLHATAQPAAIAQAAASSTASASSLHEHGALMDEHNQLQTDLRACLDFDTATHSLGQHFVVQHSPTHPLPLHNKPPEHDSAAGDTSKTTPLLCKRSGIFVSAQIDLNKIVLIGAMKKKFSKNGNRQPSISGKLPRQFAEYRKSIFRVTSGPIHSYKSLGRSKPLL